ncbi:MAG: tetratricopeptide repeat protein [Bacteroidia bacterium]
MKKLLLSFFYFVILNFIQEFSFAQNLPSGKPSNKIDSLQLCVQHAKDDTIKAESLNKLSEELSDQGSYPQAYANAQKALYIAQTIKNKKELSFALWNIANIYYDQNDYSKSLEYYLKSLQIKEEMAKPYPNDYKKQKELAISYNEIGYVYDYLSNYPKALEYYFRCLKTSEKINYKECVAVSYANIAGIFDYQKDYAKAFEYDFKAAEMNIKLGRKAGLGVVYNNIGNLYYKKQNYNEALNYHLKALKIRKELNDELQVASSFNNIGNVYMAFSTLPQDTILKYFPVFKGVSIDKIKNSLLDSASNDLERSLTIAKSQKHDYGMMLGYIGLGDVNFDKKKWDEALDFYSKAAESGVKLKTQKELYEVYGKMADICNKLGKYNEAYRNQKLYSDLKDTVFNDTKEKDFGKQEARFEYDKELFAKQKEQEKKDAVTSEEKRRQKLIAMAATGGLILVVIFALFILKSARQKQKANIEITRQKEIIEERNKEVHDSITYAKRIQTAILPPNKQVKEYLPDSFILFKPKDIVSGDFYWMEVIEARQKGNAIESDEASIIFLAAADCTGHGVPGAMVSVVGHNALNRCIKEFGLTQPAEILNKLTLLVEETFEKSENEVKDGMDISLLSISITPHSPVITVNWAGANNPIWIIKNSENAQRRSELKEIKPDKQPIGKFEKRRPFTNHVLELQKGDLIYIFTDGFADQFGGAKGKKFKYKQLAELITDFQSKNMEDQKKALNAAFESWQGDLEQIDDVCIIGVRV